MRNIVVNVLYETQYAIPVFDGFMLHYKYLKSTYINNILLKTVFNLCIFMLLGIA